MSPRPRSFPRDLGLTSLESPAPPWIETTLPSPIGYVEVLLHLHGLVAEGLLARPHLIDATAPGIRIDPAEVGLLNELLEQAATRQVGPIAVLVRDEAVGEWIRGIATRFPRLSIGTFSEQDQAAGWLERQQPRTAPA